MRGKYIFGKKHLEYMKRCASSVINVAEGAVRAGKTVDHVFVFATLLESAPDKLHLATGATQNSAKLNIGDCNGLGLESYFGPRAVWGRYQGADCLRIRTRSGEKIVIFSGGGRADSYKSIRGNSYGMWIATEINLHHDTMIKEAFNRQLAARGRRVFWDLNPSVPGAPVYRDYIDLYAAKAAAGELPEGYYNYCRFTIFDNPSVTPERLSEILSQYDRDSIWYRRDILGERCAAEGLVYPYFVRERAKIVVRECDIPRDKIEFITVGVDFGGNRSASTYVACAFTYNCGIWIIAEHIVTGTKGEIDPMRVSLEFEDFIRRIEKLYAGIDVRYAFCDNEAQYLINGLRRHMSGRGFSIRIGDSIKRRIRDRIDCTCALMVSGKFHVSENCRELQKGLAEAVWNPESEKDERLDNFTSDIDILDAMEYSFERYIGNRL